MRIWELDIPVNVKYIADPTMHSMPSLTLAPNGKWLAFTGHMVSVYACSLDFTPNMRYEFDLSRYFEQE